MVLIKIFVAIILTKLQRSEGREKVKKTLENGKGGAETAKFGVCEEVVDGKIFIGTVVAGKGAK